MRIAIGADHGGYPLNERVSKELDEAGHAVIEFCTHSGSRPDDSPDYAIQVGEAVHNGQAEIGILICGSGVGAAVAATKLQRIPAALCGDTYSGHQSREHDNCNELCLGARVVGEELALDIVRAFVAARFSGEERHRRRLRRFWQLRTKSGVNPPSRPELSIHESLIYKLRGIRDRDHCQFESLWVGKAGLPPLFLYPTTNRSARGITETQPA